MSSYRFQTKAMGSRSILKIVFYIFIVVIIPILFFVTVTSCSFKLFQLFHLPEKSEEELQSEKNKLKDVKMTKEKRDEANRLLDMLKNRSEPSLDKKKNGPRERVVRKDIEDLIDGEWKKGWPYLQSMEIETIASNINGDDGILVHTQDLRSFDPGDSVSREYHPNSGVKPEPVVKLSFVHLSDVQLRDERVYMWNKKFTEFLDYFSSGFDHESDMVIYDHSYYLTQIGIINLLQREGKNALPAAEKPSFMIHTGDAPHMGVVGEVYEFIYATNHLNIPWYNVLGNHDYQVYGNLSSKNVGVIDPNMGFQTVTSRYNFINMHGKGYEIHNRRRGKGYEVHKLVYFSPFTAPHEETYDKTKSVYNGFDRDGSEFLVEGTSDDRHGKPCEKCPGYYHFEAKKPENGDPGILVVVLDTSTKKFEFARGTVLREGETDKTENPEQIKWLRDVLEDYPAKDNWMVLAFGHHPLKRKEFKDKSYKKVEKLFHNPKYNVVAYFCGHTHKHWVEYHKNDDHPDTFGFWEITTDSIMEYPKKGSLVHIVSNKDGSWAIKLRSFWPYFLDKKLPADALAIEMLSNAKKCFEASKNDSKGEKMDDYSILNPKYHDVVLRFSFPKRSKEQIK